MGQVLVRRANDAFGVFRYLNVTVDGIRVGGLRPGQQMRVDLPTGAHAVVGSMDWVRSRELTFEVSQNTQTQVELSIPFLSGFVKTFLWPRNAVRARLVS
jgi:hypothetical protein